MSFCKKIKCECGCEFLVEMTAREAFVGIYEKLNEDGIDNQKPDKFTHGPTATKPKDRRCRNCGKVGHRADHCPTVSKDPADEAPAAESDEFSAIPKISQQKFEHIKNLQESETTSKEAAADAGVSLMIVNRIYQSRDWEYFIDHFQPE